MQKHNIEYKDFSQAKAASSYAEAFDYVCREALQKIRKFEQYYDVILIDEAQDFSSDFLRLCYEILREPKRLIYAYDELQNLSKKIMKSLEEIFGLDNNGQPRVRLQNRPGEPKQDIILEKCYRNSRPILASAHALGFGIYRNNKKLVQMFDNSGLWLDIGYEVVSGDLEDETSCKSVLRVNMKNKFHSRKFASTVKNGLKLIENQAQITSYSRITKN